MQPVVALSCNYCHYNGNNYMIMQQPAACVIGCHTFSLEKNVE